MGLLAETQQAFAEAQRRIAQFETEMADLSAAIDLRGRKLGQYQALYFDAKIEIDKLRHLQGETVSVQAERQKKEKALAQCDALSLALRKNREVHFRETAALTKLLEKQRQRLEDQRKKLEDQQTKIKTISLEKAALLSSTSWKITSPLRSIVSKFRKSHRRQPKIS